MDVREQLIRALVSYGIYHARKMSVEEMRNLLAELQRVDEVINSEKSSAREKATGMISGRF